MASGVNVDQNCIHEFHHFKLSKKDAFIIFGFNESGAKIIVLDKEPKSNDTDSLDAKNSHWINLISKLPRHDVRYAVTDVHFNTSEGHKSKMVFITWAPDTVGIKRRVLITSGKNSLRLALTNLTDTIEANSYQDLDLATVVAKFNGTLDE